MVTYQVLVNALLVRIRSTTISLMEFARMSILIVIITIALILAMEYVYP